MSFSSLRRVLRTARKGLCATCSKARYPQLEAAGAGHVGCLIYTMETIGTLIKDDHEVTAMHVAARKGQIAILIYLIENEVVKPDSLLRAKNGATPAHDAAGTGNLECLKYLLTRTQAGPNDLDNSAATLLHWAAQSGHLKVVQWLVVDAQAPIDVVAKNGITPFHLSAARNHLNVLRWLVGFAFRHHQQPMKLVNAKDKNGSTPLYHAAHAGHSDIVQWLASKGGGDPTVANRQGLAPLHAATIAGNFKVVQFLFQFGLATAPGGLRTTEGASSLHFAAAENHTEIMNWLLGHKEVTGSERDYYQSTPLHDAAENGNLSAIQVLRDAGTDPTLPDVEGNTPRDLALKYGHGKCVTFLDSWVKDIMKKRMSNGGIVKESSLPSRSKIQRSRHTQGQMIDRYSHAPPHMKPVSAFDTDDDYMIQMMDNTGEGWETLHDLMDEDEIEQLSQFDQELQENDTMQTDAESKRRIFEENLSRENAERQKKLKAAKRQEEEREMEIRSRFMKESHLDYESVGNGSTMKGNEFSEGTQQQNNSLSLQPKIGRKEKTMSLPRSLQDSEIIIPPKRTMDDMDTGSKRSVWSKLLGKRSSNNQPGSLPHSKSWSTEPRKPRRPDPHEWSIPNPPPLPTVEFLTGKSRVPHKTNLSLKEELQQVVPSSVWGRDAYDDENEGSDSDQEKTLEKKPTKMKSLKAGGGGVGGGRKKKKQDAIIIDSSKQPKKSIAQRRQVTPIPSLQNVQVPKSDISPGSIQPVRAAPPPPSPIPPPLPTLPPPPPTPPETENDDKKKDGKVAPSPITKAVSARGNKKVMTRKDTPSTSGFANQLQQALSSAKGQEPKALHSGVLKKVTPPPSNPSSSKPPLTSTSSSSARPKLQRQAAIDRHRGEHVQPSKVTEEEVDSDDDDSSFTSSSEEETDTSDDITSDSDDSDEGNDGSDRPIMARNMGIHGAKIAKEVMQRMKNQRYPSIFLKPIITLDTIVEVRHEVVYQADTKDEMADTFVKLVAKKKALRAWKQHVRKLKLARQKAEAMALRHRRAILANTFYSWIQVKNEADVAISERMQEARKHYRKKLKRKVLQKWKAISESGIKYGELEEKSLQWLNAQMISLGKPQIDNLLKSIADGTLIIMALAKASGKSVPRYKTAPKVKIHRQDNWKVAHQFMTSLGVNTKDFEPADLANLEEHSIHIMFSNIFKWLNL